MNIVGTQSKRDFLAISFAASITGFGILGSVSSALVITLAVVGFFLYVSGNISFDKPEFLMRWSRIILIFVTVSLLVASYHYFSGHGFGVMLNRIAFLCFLPLVALMSQLKREDLLEAVEKGACIVAFFVLFIALSAQISPLGRVSLAAGNPGPFSVTMAVNSAICLFAFARRKTNSKNLVYLAGAVAAIICVLLSGMRTMLPAIVLLPFLALALRGLLRKQKLNRKGYVAIAVVGFCLLLATSPFLVPRLNMVVSDFQNLMTEGNYNTSLGQRLMMWDYAVEMIPQRPWFGFGTVETSRGLDAFTIAEYGLSVDKTHLHNFILNALMIGGLAELLVLLLLLAAPVLLMWNLDKNDKHSVFGWFFGVAITLIYLSSGMLNILFSHDIMDSLYISSIAFAARMGIRDDHDGNLV